MCTTSVCRICLEGNVKMFSIRNHQLLEMYEKLSSAKLNTMERPQSVCFMCCSLLLRSCRFSEMAHRSEQILTDMFDEGIEVTEESIIMVTSGLKHNVIDLLVAPMQLVTVNDSESNKISPFTIKDESLVTPLEQQENTLFEDQHVTEESIVHKDNLNSIDEHQSSLKLSSNRDLNMYQCNECKEIFNNKKKLVSHLTKTHKEDICNTSLNKRKHEKELVQQFQPANKQYLYTCKQCNNRFISKSSLIIHMRIHSGRKPYKCSQCDQGFTRKSSLTAHTRIHTGEKLFNCEQCHKGFFCKYNLIRHIRTHTGEKQFKCEQCDKAFSAKCSLLTHTMAIHIGQKQFKCMHCDTHFSQKKSLVSHLQIHAKEKLYKCQQCDKDVFLKYNLTRHIQTHARENPYKCTQCVKQFSTKNSLKTHNMQIHIEEKLYKCMHCDKLFSLKRNLIIHMQSHTHEKSL